MAQQRAPLLAGLMMASVSPSIIAQTHQALPAVTVEVSRSWCPVDNDWAARQAIAGGSAGMLDPSSIDGVSVVAKSVHRIVSLQSVGQQSVPDGTASMSLGSTRLGRSIWLDAMGGGIFARPLGISSFDGRFESWEYAPLYASIAYYFFTTQFLDAHSFAFLDADVRQIGFCSLKRRDTFIDGRITLDGDGAIVAVDWAYGTPSPDEQAGGRVEFAPDGGKPFPTEGVFWRRLPLGAFQEWVDRYSSWSITVGS